MKNNSDLFCSCSLIEFIGRERSLNRSELLRFMGGKTIRRIYRYADVFHCEMIEKTADDFITNLSIPKGTFDNVASCRYDVPDYWTIGEVYERLIEDISRTTPIKEVGLEEAKIDDIIRTVYQQGNTAG